MSQALTKPITFDELIEFLMRLSEIYSAFAVLKKRYFTLIFFSDTCMSFANAEVFTLLNNS
jgi:hypothetical protein